MIGPFIFWGAMMTQKGATVFLFFLLSSSLLATSSEHGTAVASDRVVGSDRFVKISEKIKPSVVNITVTRPGTPDKGRFRLVLDKFLGIKRTNDVEDFFSFILFQEYPQRDFVEKLAGSGMIIRPDGLILTNEHVAASKGLLEVVLADGREFPAEIVGRDYLSDLALIKINADHLPVVRFGNSDALRVGEWVLAIGNSLGLHYTVSAGIVSAKERNLFEEDSRPYFNMLQTDAPINLGNSGGPLVNMRGEVVGINTSVIPKGQSIGFATPIDDVKKILPELIATGEVERGWLGVTFRSIRSTGGALLVERVFLGGPAEKAGIRPGDTLLSINGRELHTPKEVSELIQNIDAGSAIHLVVKRGSQTIPMEFLVEAMPILEVRGRKNDPAGFEGFILKLPVRTRWLLIIGAVLFSILLIDVNKDMKQKKTSMLQRDIDRRSKERREKVIPIEEIRVITERRGASRRVSDRREKKRRFMIF